MNSKPLATQAMQDLIELSVFAQTHSRAAEALQEHFQLAIPVLVIDVEDNSAEVAGENVISFKLNEALMAHLIALRADQRERLNS